MGVLRDDLGMRAYKFLRRDGTNLLTGFRWPVGEWVEADGPLAWCDWCATYVEQLRETIRLAGTLQDEDVPAPVMDVLIEAFREMRGS